MTSHPQTPDATHVAPTCRRLLIVCTGMDADEALFESVLPYARAWGARVYLLSVIETGTEVDHVARALGVTRDEVARRAARERRLHLETSAREALPDCEVEIAVTVGKPFIEIVHFVQAHEIELVVKNAESLRGVKRFLFASADQHLLRKCPSPVWLRRPSSRQADNVVLAAVDVDYAIAGEPETLKALNERILETAALLAGGMNAAIHVLHVWDAPAEGLVRTWSDGRNARTVVQTYVSQVRTSHWHNLLRLVETVEARIGAGAGPMKPGLERGNVAEVIARHVGESPPALLVMGTIARTGLPGFIIGNTAEDIINSIECPVVTVKPPGFHSPIPSDPTGVRQSPDDA